MLIYSGVCATGSIPPVPFCLSASAVRSTPSRSGFLKIRLPFEQLSLRCGAFQDKAEVGPPVLPARALITTYVNRTR